MVLADLLYTVVSTLVGIAYPAFMSFKAIKSQKDTKKWLEYWTVYSLYSVLEWLVLDNVVSGLPAYLIIKVVFLCWLVNEGAQYIYVNGLEKVLVQHEKTIDDALEKATAQAMVKANELKSQGLDLAKKHAGSLFQAATAKEGEAKDAGKAE